MPVITLRDLSAPECTPFFHLTDAQLRSRQEPEQGLFIAEGPKVVLSALDAGYKPVSLLMREKFIAGLGADALLLSPTCCDPLHRRAVRVCMGAVFLVPWARTGADGGFPLLRELGFATVGLALREDCVSLDDPRLAEAERLAVYLGTEDTGLRDETIRQCDFIAKIPMARGIDSLNVAAAAAIAFWQLRVR